jgi:hypothetical protein
MFHMHRSLPELSGSSLISVCDLCPSICTKSAEEDSMMQRLFALFLAIPLVFATTGAPVFATVPSRTAKSQHVATPSDAQIEATIRTKLAKSKIGKDGFTFRVQRGVVTWEGSTSVMQHKGSATRMARTAGAAQVFNNIQVSATAKAKAASNLKKASVQP